MWDRKRDRCIEQSCGFCGRGKGWDDLGEWHWKKNNKIWLLENQMHRLRTNLWLLAGGWWEESIVRICYWYHTVIFKMDNQKGPTVQHIELCSILCNNLNGKISWKRIDTCIWITESLCYIPETITTLLINSILI